MSLASLSLAKDDLNEYLKPTKIIDFGTQKIIDCANSLAQGLNGEILIAKRVYEFVRDEIHHSFDIKGKVVTCKASDVLREGEGICYAKSHLLAALLRYLGIPAGFCYQKLVFSDENPRLVLHGLNAIYLKEIDRWIRVDARGNKEGVNAQFSLEKEILAFPVRSELGEADIRMVYADPNVNVVSVLERSKTLEELEKNLPTEL